MSNTWEPYMRIALDEAQKAQEISGDVPVGALILSPEGQIIAQRHNEKELRQDPSAHAEMLAIREAAEKIGEWRLTGHTLVVTLEPCAMCAGAIQAARLEKVVFGAWDERVGASGSLYDLVRDRRLGSEIQVITGVLEEEAGEQLKAFFAKKR